jgi:hypothetical protein
MKIDERDLKLLGDFLNHLRLELREEIEKGVPEDAYCWRGDRSDVVESRLEEAVANVLHATALDLVQKYSAWISETEG